MKFIILKENIKEGINIVERIAVKSFSLPILNNILIKAEKNLLNLASTNLEVGINWWSLTKVEKEGKIVIPNKIFSSLISLLPKEKLSFEEKDLIITIKGEKNKTTIKGMTADEFPIIPQIKDGEILTINSRLFCNSLKKIVDIPVVSTTRPEISGIYFFLSKDFIKIAATDSFRLGEKTISHYSSLSGSFSLILPQKAVREIINIFGEVDGDLKIAFSPNQIQFEIPMSEVDHPKIQLVSRLIDGEYPNYEEILPKGFQTQICLPREDFLNQVKTASIFSAKINEVKIKISSKEGKINISSQNPDLGEYRSDLIGKVKGEDLEISFNWRFLIDGIANITSSEIVFELNGEEGPTALRPVGDSSYFYVLMPIKAS